MTIMRKYSRYFSDRWLHSPYKQRFFTFNIQKNPQNTDFGSSYLTPPVLLKMAAAGFELQSRQICGDGRQAAAALIETSIVNEL